MLPPEAIEEFKGLYKKRFKKDLSNEEASKRANNLVNLYKFVYIPLPETEESKARVNKAYDILFEATLKRKSDTT